MKLKDFVKVRSDEIRGGIVPKDGWTNEEVIDELKLLDKEIKGDLRKVLEGIEPPQDSAFSDLRGRSKLNCVLGYNILKNQLLSALEEKKEGKP